MYSPLADQNVNKKRNIPIEGILSSALISIVAFMIVLLDSGPIIPPFPKNFSSLDCLGVSIQEYTEGDGKMHFNFKAPPSVEYPPEYLPNFITIKAKTRDVPIMYTVDSYKDIRRDSHNLNISIKHQFGGNTSFYFKCINNNIGKATYEVSDPEYYYNDRSRTYNPQGDEAYYTDVCLEYQKILYFTKLKTSKNKQKHDKDPLVFEFLNEKLGRYLEHKKVSTNKNNTFLITNSSTESWKAAIFWAIPIANSIQTFGSDDNLFVLRDYPQPGLAEALEKHSELWAERQQEIMCFSKLHINRALSSPSVTDELLDEYISMGIEAVQNQFQADKIDSVGVGEELISHLGEIQNLFPNKTVHLIKHNLPINTTISILERCILLIGTHYRTLGLAPLLPTGAYVVDASSPKECYRFIEKISDLGKLNYIKLNDGGKCSCENFVCFSETPLKRFDIQKLISLLD